MRAQVSWSGIRFPIVETLLTLGSTTPMTMIYLCCMPSCEIMFLADEFPQQGGFGPGATSPVTLHLYVTDADAAFARAVEAGAKVGMPLADMFWGDRYGKLIDPFGHHWSIAEHLEDLTPEQMQERMVAAMAAMGRPSCE
jgi:predicted enzyme related to lactoylglutathione lyase